MLLPYKKMCDQRKVKHYYSLRFSKNKYYKKHRFYILALPMQVHVDVTVIESDDVASAIAEEVAKGAITKLVIGASSHLIFTRYLLDIPIYIAL